MPNQYTKRPRTALERFAERCSFDATTGCVLWTGGTSAGHGNTARYGKFWFNGMIYAHRWAAEHIHGLTIAGLQVGHCCPHGPNTLCVQHVEAITQAANLAEQNARLGGVGQSAGDRQYWLFVSLGIEPAPPGPVIEPDAVPFYNPPEWFKPFMQIAGADNAVPF